MTPLGSPERQPRTLNKGDIFIPALTAVFRRSDLSLFQGDAGPRAVVSAEDGSGRMWALQRRPPGRTVVRFGRPGGRWRSRLLGPAVGATTVTGERNILMVVGRRLPTDHERAVQLLGDLYRRGRWDHPQVSADGKRWWQFTPAKVRRLLAHSSSD